jgi:hypothetical protein
MQFSDAAARTLFDQTVLDERAARVTYYWNTDRRAVIAKTLSPRFYDSYLQEKFDPKLLTPEDIEAAQSNPNPTTIEPADPKWRTGPLTD